jgi:chromosomal replication initiation ATPase DnaA
MNMTRPPFVAALVAEVFSRHQVNTDYAYRIRSNEARIVAARAEVMRRLRERGFSLPQIGRWLGGMHHTSVFHHVGKLRSNEPDVFTPDLSGEWAI